MEASLVMRVLYYANEYYAPHGARTHAREFFAALKNQSQVDLACVFPQQPIAGRKTNGKRDESSGGVRSWLKRMLPERLTRILKIIFPNGRIYRQLAEIIRLHGIDTIIMRVAEEFRYVGYLRRDFPELRICVEMNSTIFTESECGMPFRSFFEWLEVRQYAKARYVSVVSSYWRDYLVKRGLNSDRVVVNPNGVNPDHFRITGDGLNDLRQRYCIPDQAFVLGYVGGMESFRRLPGLVDAVAGLRRQGLDDLFLLMIGDGFDREKVLERLEANEDVMTGWSCWQSWQDHEVIPRTLQLFDLALFPFTAPYCSPLKLFEYMAMGLPVIGPDVPAVREVFEDGKHLRLVKQDGSNLEELIRTLRRNETLRKELGFLGMKKVLEGYTWQDNARRLLEVVG